MDGPFLKVIRTSTPMVSISVELVYEIICLYNGLPDDQNASRMFAFFLIGFLGVFFLFFSLVNPFLVVVEQPYRVQSVFKIFEFNHLFFRN